MTLEVLFFASYGDLVGAPSVSVDLPDGATVADLVDTVRGRDEAFGRLPAHPAVAVNRTVVAHRHPLAEGDEVAFLPPVAGG
jgi:molybdopterin synthase catalytic subunit